ncbi:hypothetical protein [Idiomarina sp.]|uniref:hypothetical protein n=1 Tax=Idiomarina sp. TaxID=1874361 RepID=UPI0025B96E1C|nr:hypothetical protein [Idiomarina sp.]NQZ04104.1 hypothetical protein [Idiomarina sp.]
MVNFDAMIPLIPKDARIPVSHNEEQLKVEQVEKTQKLAAVEEEQENSIGDRDAEHHEQGAQSRDGKANEEQSEDDERRDGDGHIDTYA